MDKIEQKDEFQEPREKRTYDPLPNNKFTYLTQVPSDNPYEIARNIERINKQRTTIKTSSTERY